jgi:hypothetical protein
LFGVTGIMNRKRFIIIGIVVILIAAYAISIIPNIRRHSERKRITAALQSLPLERFVAAVQALARDKRLTNGMAPAAVSLRELVSGGYIGTNDIRGLEASGAIVSVTAVTATNAIDPTQAWVRVPALGYDMCLMADGSIQGVTK